MKDSEIKNIADIIECAKGGDRDAFSQLYTEYYTPVYRYIYFRNKSGREHTAEDITQDVFLKAYISFSRYTYSGKSPLAYFYTIARNIIIDQSRKKKIKLVQLELENKTLEEFPDITDNSIDRLAKEEEREYVHSKISLLPPDQQDVIILHFIDGLSTKEIAEILKKNEAAVRQLQSKGLKLLRIILNNYEQQ